HGGDAREILARIARSGEQQAVPVDERRRMQLDARGLGKERRAEQLAFQVIGPAVQRTDDVLGVAAALEHDRLAVPADVRQQLDALMLRASVAHQHLGMVGVREGVIVADLGYHQLVADVVRSRLEQQLLLFFEDLWIEVPRHRQLRPARSSSLELRYVRHALKAPKSL